MKLVAIFVLAQALAAVAAPADSTLPAPPSGTGTLSPPGQPQSGVFSGPPPSGTPGEPSGPIPTGAPPSGLPISGQPPAATETVANVRRADESDLPPPPSGTPSGPPPNETGVPPSGIPSGPKPSGTPPALPTDAAVNEQQAGEGVAI